jgi:hypothetical protein
MAKTEVTQQELNLMAELDGEPPFAPEAGKELDSEEETTAFKNAMAFSQEIKATLATGVTDEAIPEAWIEMIQGFDLEEPKKTAPPDPNRNFILDITALVQSFFRPSYAFGGAFAFFLGIALVVQINDGPQSWNDTYASLEDVPTLQTAEGSNTFLGDYFERPQVAVRGITEQVSPIDSIAKSLNSNQPVSIAPGEELDKLALSLQAAELNGKAFALVPAADEKLWFSIRGKITVRDGEDRGDCKLVQVSLEKDGNPDSSLNNYFLQYCKQRWSNKIVPLGKN